MELAPGPMQAGSIFKIQSEISQNGLALVTCFFVSDPWLIPW